MNLYLTRVAVFSLLSCFLAMPVSAQTAQPDSIGFTDKTLTLEEGTTKAVTIEGYELKSKSTIKVIVAEDIKGQAVLFDSSPDSTTQLELVLPEGSSSRTITVKSPQDDAYEHEQNYTMQLVGPEFQDCVRCPKMIKVPPGSFQMGSPEEEEGRGGDESPVHKVTIDYRFAVGVYEVTFDEWDYCLDQGGCDGFHPGDNGFGRDDRPVINVSWIAATSYTKWLAEETKKEYRLLTEAEWEYVARAGTTTPFYFGNTISTDQANYDGQQTYGSGVIGTYLRKTLPVGSFPANRFGLHDVHGNVFEWVKDCWHENYEGAPTDGSARIAGDDCDGFNDRVFRGGSWESFPQRLRSANRDWNYANNYGNFIGFRVALTLTTP